MSFKIWATSFAVVFSLTLAPAFGAIKVGLVLDKGGKDDKSFNAAAFKGATEAQKKLGIELKTVEASDDSMVEPSLRTFAQRGYDLVIGIGFVMGAPIKKIATEFPKTNFLLVDEETDAPNVRAVTFKEHEGSFLVGAIAALTSKSKVVGFVGGMDIPLIQRFAMGYEAGAKAIDPKFKVIKRFVGATSDGWRNPTKAKELALSEYQDGAEVIFSAAGASGLGVFDAAEEKKKFAIGVDSNQNWVKPGRILTSMVKRIDTAVYDAIDMTNKKAFKAGKFTMGLKEKAIDYAIDDNNRKLITPEIEKRVESLRKDILSGKIQVPDYYKVGNQKPAKAG